MSRFALLIVWSLVPYRIPCAVAITPPVPPREPRSPHEVKTSHPSSIHPYFAGGCRRRLLPCGPAHRWAPICGCVSTLGHEAVRRFVRGRTAELGAMGRLSWKEGRLGARRPHDAGTVQKLPGKWQHGMSQVPRQGRVSAALARSPQLVRCAGSRRESMLRPQNRVMARRRAVWVSRVRTQGCDPLRCMFRHRQAQWEHVAAQFQVRAPHRVCGQLS